MSASIEVVVEQPFDWIGSVMVPVAAILVSSGIALWLAIRERRASEKAAIRAAAAEMIRGLHELSRVIEFQPQRARIDPAHDPVQGEMAVFEAHLDKRTAPVGVFLDTVFHRMMAATERDAFIVTPKWMASLIDAWLRGELRVKDFVSNMPSTNDALWQVPHPREWRDVLQGKPLQEARAREGKRRAYDSATKE